MLPGQKSWYGATPTRPTCFPARSASREKTPIRIYPKDFSDCPPTRAQPESKRQHCIDEIGNIEQKVALLQPDIAILASYWPYQDQLDGLSETVGISCAASMFTV